MISGALLIVLVVVLIVVALQFSSRRDRTVTSTSRPMVPPDLRPVDAKPRGLAADLERWTRLGLLSREQADAILAHEQHAIAVSAPETGAVADVTRRSRVPAVAEALGYLGGMLAMVGLGLVVGNYWPDMATAGRLALSGGGALVLLAAGGLVRERADAALVRLRAFLWLASTASAALFAGVLAADAFGAEDGATIAAACSGLVLVYSGVLWWGRERPVQQLTFFAALCVFAGTMAAQFAGMGPTGLAVWVAGAASLVLGLRRLVPSARLPESTGAGAVIVGAVLTTTEWQGFGLVWGSLSAVGLLTLAMLPGLAPDRADHLLFGIVGGVAFTQMLPGMLGYFANDAAAATGVVTWIAGWLLIWAGSRRVTRVPVATEIAGGAGVIGGAALTWAQWQGATPVFGVLTAVSLIALGMLPGQVLLSVFGSIGLLVNVPWTIGWFFPGEERAPLLIMVTGALIIGVAVLLARMGGRFRRELTEPSGGANAAVPPPAAPHGPLRRPAA